MKKLFLFFPLAVCLAPILASAQMAFSAKDSININNINEMVLVHGDMGWDPVTGMNHTYFPDSTKRGINFANSIWMAGYDGGGNLHVSAETYRQIGNDYWPGPIGAGDSVSYASSAQWAKVWKVNRTDITSFLALSTLTTGTIPASILTWPGTGNTYATGAGGVPITISAPMAPFVDLNGNGIYEPLLGEYPDIKGDQALWTVFSDNGRTHSETHGLPLGLEVHTMVYAFHRGTLIDNVVYYDYTLLNKSADNYTGFRVGMWDDMDLGYYRDDYIGFDSTWRMGITYNGNNNDGGGVTAGTYGPKIPIAGVTMIQLPGDAGTSYEPVGNFDYYNNDTTANGNPTVDTEYNNLLHGKTRAGQHFRNDFSGPGVPCPGTGTGINTNYVFPGDPSVSSSWSECACPNNPGDRRFIIITNDFTLNAGASEHLLMALVTTNPDTLNGCPGNSFAGLRTVADTAWNFINNLTASVKNVKTVGAIKVYPNPAGSFLTIENTGNMVQDANIIIYNVLGQVMNTPIETQVRKWIANISSLPPGLYNILFRTASGQECVKFVKE
jgi:hypothetical protein